MGNVMSIAEPKSRRKDPIERRAEIVSEASQIAVSEGLERVTAKRVAEKLGVVPGLVNHYFAAADDLVAAAFGFAVRRERSEIYELAAKQDGPVAQLRCILAEWLDPDRDEVSLLWLDAWQASRRRPALLDEVVAEMDTDALELSRLIQSGVDSGDFVVDEAASAALRIMALVDGHSVQEAVRTRKDSRVVAAFAVRASETELGLPAGALAR